MGHLGSASESSSASIYLDRSPSHSLVHTSSHSSPSPSASQASALFLQPSSNTSSPSLYAAFNKVLTLVNTFRKRVKTHSQISRKLQSRKNADQFCRDFERQAYDKIDKYLGRETKISQARDIKAATSDLDSSEDSINGLLKGIDCHVNAGGLSLSTLASNNHLLLNRKSDFHIQHFSVKELQQITVHVSDLLETLRRAAPPDCTFPPSKTDPTIDHTYIANLEHLLLCLQQQLFCHFIANLSHILRQNTIECQKDHERYCKEWFFEYPDARHPLSTTWPWAIKPSLAVLWGVCWMFVENKWCYYDENMNLVDSAGQIVLFSHQVRGFFAAQNQSPGENFVNPDFGPARRDSRLMPQPSHAGRNRVAQPQQAHHRTSTTAYAPNLGDYAYPAPGPQDFPVTASNTAAQPPLTASTENFLPEAHQYQFTDLGHSYNAYVPEQAENSWPPPSKPAPANQSYSQTQFPRRPENLGRARALPHQGHHLTAPRIHIDIPTNSIEYPVQPQESRVSSASSYYPQSVTTPTGPNLLTTPDSRLRQRYSTPTMTTEQLPHEVNMPGQVSPNLGPVQQSLQPSPLHSPHPDQAPRKRSFSQISQHDITIPQAQMQPEHTPEHHDQNGYERANEPSPTFADDNFRQRSIKRPDPPTTPDGKYWCDYSNECNGLTFDRKCEWSKHMDKHDRPYRCPQPQCAKLQGFTYSGGLLRHEREVHGKHGGPKEQLRCTVSDCKRHTGKGFTRKENLNEHLRRVHGIITDGSQLRQIAADAVPGAEAAETPASRFSDNHEMDDLTGISPIYPMPDKRRRLDNATSPHSASEDFEGELARLRQDNIAKDERIQRVEQEHAETQQRLKNLEMMLGQLTSNSLNKAEADELKLQREG